MLKIFLFSLFFVAIQTINAQQIDTLRIYISPEDFENMEYLRSQVLKTEKTKSGQKFFPCVIKSNSLFTSAKIRLKGDRIMHYEDAQQSFRIETNDDNQVFSVKKFSIHKAKTKNYIYESFYHNALKELGLIGLRYFYVRLYLNNLDMGIYAFEEFNGKELIENSQRKEGYIFHFSEDFNNTILDSMPIELFGKSPKKEPLKSNYQFQKKLLTDFKNGNKSVSEVFDVDKLAKFYAFSDIFEYHHGAVAKSVRYYYSPISCKFEPIGFDGHHGTQTGTFIAAELGINPNCGWYYDLYDEWFKLLFNNPKTFDYKFYSSYIKSLNQMSEKKFTDSLINLLSPQNEIDLNKIKSDLTPPLKDKIFSFGPEPFQFDLSYVNVRQTHIKELLSEKQRLSAFIISNSKNELTIAIRNTERLAIELIALKSDLEIISNLNQIILLPNFNTRTDSSYTLYTFKNIALKNLTSLSIDYNVVGDFKKQNSLIQNKIISSNTSAKCIINPITNNEELNELIKNKFISIDSKNKTIFIKKGEWKINKPLIIPEDYTLFIKEGTIIDLTNNAYIKSNSPCIFTGTKNMPITIHSSDTSGQGLFVIAPNQLSKFDYVNFNHLKSINQKTWQLSGSVTIFESPVSFINCTFKNMLSEDALNIIRTTFEIDACEFQNIKSDAFDGDFVNGSITASKFLNCENEGIDVSGSKIKISNTLLSQIKDKGISCGEESSVEANNVTISDSKIGAASKDKSTLTINNSKINNCQYGFSAYQKKNVYGPGFINVNKCELTNVNENYLLENGSTIIHDSKKIDSYQKFIKFILYDYNSK